MRILASLVSAALLWPSYLAAADGLGAADKDAKAELAFKVTGNGERFSYSIKHPEMVRAAWIEVLDRPIVLDKKDVPVAANGELDWEWDRHDLDSLMYDDDPEEGPLDLYLDDPRGQTITCDINTVMTATPGGLVAGTLVGTRTKFADDGSLALSFTRVAQGGEAVTVPVMGASLTSLTKFHVKTEGGAKCDDSLVHAQVQDLSHARITVSGECFRKAGAVYVGAVDNFDDEHSAWIQIASPQSPVLKSVSPSSVSPTLPQEKLLLVLHGRNFTKNSQVNTGYFLGTPSILMMPQLRLDTEYVSPTELRARIAEGTIDNDPLGARVWSEGENLRIWVAGDESKYELSESRDVKMKEDASEPANIAVLPPQKLPVINSVSPFPIKLMDEHSPEELKVTIRGENFVPEDKVVFDAGRWGPHDIRARTEYVSPTLLRAWLPREKWRKHQVTYRLVVEMNSGERYTQQVEDRTVD
jgi:hypothetical protein